VRFSLEKRTKAWTLNFSFKPDYKTWTRIILPVKISGTKISPVCSSRAIEVGEIRFETITTGAAAGAAKVKTGNAKSNPTAKNPKKKFGCKSCVLRLENFMVNPPLFSYLTYFGNKLKTSYLH